MAVGFILLALIILVRPLKNMEHGKDCLRGLREFLNAIHLMMAE
jgi:hypothetical protein